MINIERENDITLKNITDQIRHIEKLIKGEILKRKVQNYFETSLLKIIKRKEK